MKAESPVGQHFATMIGDQPRLVQCTEILRNTNRVNIEVVLPPHKQLLIHEVALDWLIPLNGLHVHYRHRMNEPLDRLGTITRVWSPYIHITSPTSRYPSEILMGQQGEWWTFVNPIVYFTVYGARKGSTEKKAWVASYNEIHPKVAYYRNEVTERREVFEWSSRELAQGMADKVNTGEFVFRDA